MDRPLTILLLEDDPEACREITAEVEKFDELKLVSVNNQMETALKYVSSNPPDAIILDLELHKGSGNGLAFLQHLRNLDLPTLPYVLVTTNNMDPITHEHARQMGAGFIMAKRQSDYSAESVVQFLSSIKGAIQNSRQIRAAVAAAESPAEKEAWRKNQVIAELNHVGISPSAVGRNYLIDAILLVINGQTEKIANTIGERYSKTESSVHRAMETAIDKAWKKAHIEDLLQHYTARISSARGVPTVLEFVFYYAEKVGNK